METQVSWGLEILKWNSKIKDRFKSCLRAGEMAPWVKALATEPDDLPNFWVPVELQSLVTWGASPEQVWGWDMSKPQKSHPEIGRSRTIFLPSLGLHVGVHLACTTPICAPFDVTWWPNYRFNFLSPYNGMLSKHLEFFMQMKRSQHLGTSQWCTLTLKTVFVPQGYIALIHLQ